MSPANIRASILSGSLDSVDLVVVKCVPPTFSSTISSIVSTRQHNQMCLYEVFVAAENMLSAHDALKKFSIGPTQVSVRWFQSQSHCPTLVWLSRFLSGMNPMIRSRNCTLQQSSVNCRDRCVHRELHCKIFQQVCMSFICMFVVLYYNNGWLSADTLQAVDLGLTFGQTDRSAAGHELRHKACRSVAG